MTDEKKKKLITEGLVILGWTAFFLILELIMGLALLIWQTKIAMFLFGVSTLLFLIVIGIWFAWKKSAKSNC